MKSHWFIGLSLLACSCTADDVAVSGDAAVAGESAAVVLSPTVSALTRGVSYDSGTGFPQTEKFRLYASMWSIHDKVLKTYVDDAAKDYTYDQDPVNHARLQPFVADGNVIGYEPSLVWGDGADEVGGWRAVNDYQWPQNTYNVYFYALYPTDMPALTNLSTGTGVQPRINFNGTAKHKYIDGDIDILYAVKMDSRRDRGRKQHYEERDDNVPVDMEFHHALSQIEFRGRLNRQFIDSLWTVEVRSITLHNVNGHGVLYLPTKDKIDTKYKRPLDELDPKIVDESLTMADLGVTFTPTTKRAGNNTAAPAKPVNYAIHMADYTDASTDPVNPVWPAGTKDNITLRPTDTGEDMVRQLSSLSDVIMVMPQALTRWRVAGEDNKGSGGETIAQADANLHCYLVVECHVKDSEGRDLFGTSGNDYFRKAYIPFQCIPDEYDADGNRTADRSSEPWLMDKRYIYTLWFGDGYDTNGVSNILPVRMTTTIEPWKGNTNTDAPLKQDD